MAKNKRKETLLKIGIVCLCAFTVLLSVFDFAYTSDETKNLWIGGILQQACGTIAVILLFPVLKIRLLSPPKKWLYLIPCIIVAVNNFPFWSYFNGNMHLVRTQTTDLLLFVFYCLFVGLFEELVFRGVLFSLLAGRFSNDKKGLVKTFVLSSVIFGLAHLLNLIAGAGVGATLLQVCYTTLTGGLFAFALIKTKNILCCAFIHGLYNFCGLIMEFPARGGLGTGVVFDFGTGLTMGVVALAVGIFVLYSLWKYSETERVELYSRLGIANE